MALTLGLDATPLVGQRSGVGNYTARLLTNLLQQQPDWRFLLYSNRPLPPLEPSLSGAVQIPRYFTRSRWVWTQVMLPGIVRKTKPDLCHFPNAIAPLWLSRPFVLSIHDATLFLYSRYHPKTRLITMRLVLPLIARRAAAIVTVSNSARDDLTRILRLPPEKVTVIHAAAPPHFRPVRDEAELERVRLKYGLPGDFVLYVGTIEPRKNLTRLARAIHSARRQGFPDRLVLVGPYGWSMSEFERTLKALDLQEDILLLGYVPEADLPGLYSLAKLFVFPSLYEGFGLPPVEAMACGTPVLTSNNSSLVEVCGDAALLVNPRDEEEISQALIRLLSDEPLRQKLSRAGRIRAQQYSWVRAAEMTITLYQRVLEQS